MALSSFPTVVWDIFFVAPKSDSLKNYRAHQHTIAAQHVNVGICNRWRLLALSLLFARAKRAKQKKVHKIAAVAANSPTARFRIKETSINSSSGYKCDDFWLSALVHHRTAPPASPRSENCMGKKSRRGFKFFYSYARQFSNTPFWSLLKYRNQFETSLVIFEMLVSSW